MDKVSVTKAEYKKLQKQSKAYQKLVGKFFKSVFTDSVPEVVSDFRATGQYSEDFLNDLENGLIKSKSNIVLCQ